MHFGKTIKGDFKMKKLNKKGFTIVELVIVIAVIAILAAVLIPTFATVIQKANESAALQQARNTYTEYIAALGKDVVSPINLVVKGANNMYFTVKAGQMDKTVYTTPSSAASSGFTPTSAAANVENTVDGINFSGKVFTLTNAG